MIKRNILFVIPPYLPFDEYKPTKVGQKLPSLTPPYGVLSIISFINEKKNHNIKIIDTNDLLINSDFSLEMCEEEVCNYIIKEVEDFKPDLVSISSLFNTCYPHLKYICKSLNIIDRKYKIIVGGGLATNLYKELLEDIPEIDALCFGGGEIPFALLLQNFFNIDLHKLSSAWITRKSLDLNIVPNYDFIEELDIIPIIDFSYIDLQKYNGRSYIDKDSENIEVSIHTSRGCPFRCVYCSNSMVHGRKIRMMSTERVLETIYYYKDNYNMHTLLIEDDHFLADKQRALYLLDKIRELELNVEFPNGIAVFKIDDDIAKALNDARVKIVPLAIESGSPHVLKNIINKPLTVTKIKSVVKILRKYDIRLHAFIVIGFPEEYDVHRKETLDLLSEIGVDWAHIFIVVPIAGSRLYTQCEEKGYLLTKDYNQYTISKCNILAPGVEPKEIEFYAQYMNQIINFLDNYNFRIENYDRCLEYFQNVVNHYPSQAIAHYMLYKIYMILNEKVLAKNHYLRFKNIYKNNSFYTNMIDKLKMDGYNFDRIQI